MSRELKEDLQYLRATIFLRTLPGAFKLWRISSPRRSGLTAGAVYHLSGRQPRSGLFCESFQTRWLLHRELTRRGMFIDREHVNTNPLGSAFVIFKKQQ
jgi:hypothetical protein